MPLLTIQYLEIAFIVEWYRNPQILMDNLITSIEISCGIASAVREEPYTILQIFLLLKQYFLVICKYASKYLSASLNFLRIILEN